ncbi:hypothetical protein QBC36DRAFT_27881 [Triangularia setosa]|uniref:Uncharacterized protein n=1 Tax=Triangularia setosa TaxID=2587417 RepID=A0AAN7A5W0_9PEZI|nr:hypothetical protein QBC36DRAFT_27881 [Podospora setosa]
MARVKEVAAEALTAVEESVAHLAGRAESTAKSTSDAVIAAAPARKIARLSLPRPAQFVLAAALSFGISTLGRWLVDYLAPGEWAHIARLPPAGDGVEEGLVVGWKMYVSKHFVSFFMA